MLRSFSSLFLNPLYFFYLLILVGIVCYYFQAHKSARICWGAAAAWLLLVSVSPLPNYLALARESHYPVLSAVPADFSSDSPIHILVLGAGHSNAPGYQAFDRLSEPALKRLLEGMRWYRQLPNSKLFCSGYSSTGNQSQAETLAAAALSMGIPPQDTLLQPAAVNTEMEARIYFERYGKETSLILVTSALHMPRAMHWFEHYGLHPIPAPTNHLIMLNPGDGLFSFWPSTRKITTTAKLLHEYAGMLYARMKK